MKILLDLEAWNILAAEPRDRRTDPRSVISRIFEALPIGVPIQREESDGTIMTRYSAVVE